MSNADLYREFEDFGSKMKTIAILTLIGLIASIVGSFISIFALVSLVMQIIIIIFFLLIIGDLKKAGRMLDNNKDLLGFPFKVIFGTIIRVIGLAFLQIGAIFLLLIDKITMVTLAILLSLMLTGVGLIIVGSILRLLAWGGLRTFFGENAQLFPLNITSEGRSGANLCKIGCIFDMTIFLSFIGDILRIFGYFKLASLRSLTGELSQPMYQPSQPMPMPAPVEAQSVNFCPNCGSKISMGARFCPSCGSEI
jgi:hypothetical protein